MLRKSIIALIAAAGLVVAGAPPAEAGHYCHGPAYGYHGGYRAAYYGGYQRGAYYGYNHRAYAGPAVIYRSYRPYYGGYYGTYPTRGGVSFSIGF